MHPNWKALSTVDFRYKIFVTPTNNETDVKNKKDVKNPSANITGDEASSFYKEIIETPINVQHNLKNKGRKTLKKVSKNHPPVTLNKPFDKNLLYKAVMENNHSFIRTMNFDSNQINSIDHYGWTALMMAACEGFLNTFLLLLELGADINIANRQGNTALSLAIKKQKYNIVEAIEDYKNRNNLNDSDSDECIIVDNAEKEPFYCDLCKLKFKESSKKEHRTSTLHQFNARKYKHARCYGIPESNKGFKIMVKNGWDRDHGLGPNKSGHLFPIKTVIRKQRSGLGTQQNKAKVTHFNSFDMDAIKYRPPPVPRTRKDINNEFVRGKYLERKIRAELS